MTALPQIRYEHRVVATEQRVCPSHGAYEARQWAIDPPVTPREGRPLPSFLAPFWGHCPTCDAADQAEADARAAEIQGGMTDRQRMAAARLRACGIPARYLDASLWNWVHPTDQHRACWSWARDYAASLEEALATGRSAVFLGAPGTGKTHLACGILRHVAEKGGTGLYCTAMSMLGRIKSTFGKDAHETEHAVIATLTGVDLLVIDEVGRQIDSNYEQAQLFRVLDTRYQNLKPVILVSNLTPSALRAFLGESVMDRVREAGGAIKVFDWRSHRSTARRDDATREEAQG